MCSPSNRAQSPTGPSGCFMWCPKVRICGRHATRLVVLAAIAPFLCGFISRLPFEGRVDGSRETISGTLVIPSWTRMEGRIAATTSRGVRCAGEHYWPGRGSVSYAEMECSDGRRAKFVFRSFGKYMATEAVLGDRKLTLTFPTTKPPWRPWEGRPSL